MNDAIRSDEFQRAIAGLRDYMGERCDSIDARLDKVNGRLDRHDHDLRTVVPQVARIDERVIAVKRDVKRASQARTMWPDTSGDIPIPVNSKTIASILLALAGLIVAYFTARAGG